MKERRVSCLELFYDLVHVIAIARITHHFSPDVSTGGFLDHAFMFLLIYWGWLNGSLHHDLHGNEGLRTRLMTLWQMMIIAALAITIDQPVGRRILHITIVFMIMQLYITYMWWSVGFYDRSHHRYNKPYSISYLMGLVLMGFSLTVPQTWLKLIIPLVLTAFIFFISALIEINVDIVFYLSGIIFILVVEIIYLNSLYYRLRARQVNDPE